MYINKKINFDLFLIGLILFVFFLIGINIYKDYGVSIDEHYHYTNGLHYYSFLKGLFSENSKYINITELRDSFQNFHFKNPALFDLIFAFLKDVFNMQDLQEIYFFRHLLIYAIYLVGSFYFVLILRERYENKIIVLIGLLFLLITPRIFANSFFNNKDLIFLSVCCIFFYYSIKFYTKPSLKTAVIFSLFSAIAFDVRIMAIVFIFTFFILKFLHYLDNENKITANIKYIPISIVFFTLFIYIFWPYLWIDPIRNLIDFFAVIKSKTPGMQNLYFGEYIYSKNAPWHYEIIWILITSPASIILFFIIGYFFALKNLTVNLLQSDRKKHKFWYNKKQFIDYYLLCAFTLSFFVKVKFGVSYNGWRQIYYLYPLIIYFGLNGIEFLVTKFKNKKIFYKIILLSIFVEITFLSYWNIRNHPYQYIFFNPIFKSLTKNNFDLDYWGISNKEMLEKILKMNNYKTAKIATNSFTNLNDSRRILKAEQIDNIKIVYDINDADFVINNHMKKWSTTPGEENLKKDFKIVYNLIVDENFINTIYKRVK